MSMTLLVMAAGMGSRYGGLKQLDQFGPNGETIIQYSVYDAIRAGFSKVVFVIREEFHQEFYDKIAKPFEGKIEMAFAFQSLVDLPDGFALPEGREKPWGTGQAVLCAREHIDGPFAVINGDDFYGAEAYQKLADFYSEGNASYSLVAFELGKTLSEFGGVSRGVCEVRDNQLVQVVETHGILEEDGVAISQDENARVAQDGRSMALDLPVSMNMWGFAPSLFDTLASEFVKFLEFQGQEMKSEYLLPSIVDAEIQAGREKVAVLTSASSWFGVTYQEDKPWVEKSIQDLINKGDYPQNIFGDK